MSVRIIEEQQVHCLVNAASVWGIQYNYQGLSCTLSQNADRREREQLGQCLIEECVRSVAHRYPKLDEHELPGAWDFGHIYRFYNEDEVHQVDTATVLSVCCCYDYQASEHPSWERSLACTIINAIRDTALHKLETQEAVDSLMYMSDHITDTVIAPVNDKLN